MKGSLPWIATKGYRTSGTAWLNHLIITFLIKTEQTNSTTIGSANLGEDA